jgi:PEP-CTERM motif
MRILAGAALAAAMAFSAQAYASVVSFHFDGGGFSGRGVFTFEPNVAPPDPDPLCGTASHNPCRNDPVGAFRITGITGTFSDATDGIFDAAITGLVPINPADERDAVFDPLVPSSLSFVDYPGPPSGALTYNNLLFPDGSPIDCDFPFAGTFVDVFGVAFTVAGGYTADLWGDGDLHGPGTTTYGVGVTDGINGLAYQFDGVNGALAVPEPSTWLLTLAGFGALGVGLRHRRRLARQA